ncbi:MAG: hypothetical protein WBG86_01685 [Polyangiales bacterium]
MKKLKTVVIAAAFLAIPGIFALPYGAAALESCGCEGRECEDACEGGCECDEECDCGTECECDRCEVQQ